MIAVTGATGNLGKLVINELLLKGVSAKDIVALVRDPSKATDFTAKGIQVRAANYTSPETLDKALSGVDKVLLISGNELGQRLPQHTNVVNAAKKAGVKLLAYTSILKANTSKMILAVEHFGTEKAIQASGIPYVILRNGWYIENYSENFAGALAGGALLGSAQDGKISAAARADYAAAAATVLTGNGPTNKIYELGGSVSFTMKELAGLVSDLSGKKIEYKDMPVSDYRKTLEGFGLPVPVAEMLSDSDAGIVRGDLYTESKDLEQLIGRSSTPLKNVVKAALV